MPERCEKLKLTDATVRATEGYAAPVSISEHGKKIYCVYDICVFPDQNLAGELFKNEHGKLVTDYTIIGDLAYPIVDGGVASNDFKKFTFLDDDGSNDFGTARLRVFDDQLQVLATRLFTDYWGPGFSFNGGAFSEDGKLIAVTYVNDPIGPDPMQPIQRSVLHIVRADDLSDVATYEYDGNTGQTTLFFNLDHKQYIALASTGGVYNAQNPDSQAPAILSILKLKHGNLTVVDQINLPQSFTFDIRKDGDSETILVRTSRANVGDGPIYQVTPQDSFIPNDGDEYRIYKFHHKLHKVCTKNLDLSCNGVLYPKDNCVALQKSILSDVPSFVELVHTDKHYCLKHDSSVAVPVPRRFIGKFSENGKWFVVTGAHNNFANEEPQDLNNVLLFKVD